MDMVKFINNFIYTLQLYKLFSTRDKVVLLYHRVNSEELIKDYYLKGIFVAEKEFEKQMHYLSKSKRKDKVVITFDDGYKDNFQYAIPILDKYNIKAIFFITIAFIDGLLNQWIDILNQYAIANNLSIEEFKNLSLRIKGMSVEEREYFLETLKIFQLKNDSAMSWEDVKEIQKKHIISNHTINHPNFKNETQNTITKELTESKKILKEKLNLEDTYFAYPDGDIGVDKKFIENQLKNLSYKYAFTTKRGTWKSDDNPYFIRRIPIYYWDDLATFVNKIHGINVEDNLHIRNILINILDLLGVKNWLKTKLKF